MGVKRFKRLTHIIGQNGAFGLLRLILSFALRDEMKPRYLSCERAQLPLPEGRGFPIRTVCLSFSFKQKRQCFLLMSVQCRANFLS